MKQHFAGPLAACSLLAAHAAAAQGLDPGMIPTEHIVTTDGAATGLVVLFSDAGGWGAAEDRIAAQLHDEQVAVIGIDLPEYLKTLNASTDDCVYLISDIERLGHQIERASGGTTFHAPILTGTGVGGGLALDLIAQTPAATIGGTVVSDPTVDVPLTVPLCTEAPRHQTPRGAVYSLPTGAAADPVSVVLTVDATQDVRDRVEAFQSGASSVTVQDNAAPGGEALAASIDDMLASTGDDQPDSMPVVELPAKPTHDTMAVVLSGDGGWRDLDMTIGGILQQKGVPTIGIDSLRYFWSQRTPAETAKALDDVIERYSAAWKVNNVLLVGYSFGADVLPETYLALNQNSRVKVKLVSLLAPSHQADWEITVAGWLGSASDAARPTGPALAAMPPDLLQCVYGIEEDDSPCPGLAKAGSDVIQTRGGHHFDGRYDVLATDILNRLDARVRAEAAR